MKSKTKVVVFSGAGMSAESGVSTFRDSDGLWEKYRIEEVATPEAWHRNPSLVQSFYNERRKGILQVSPNDAHLAISALEKYYDIQVITQNIDDLHERSGSTNVLHLHGNIRYAKSSGPNQEKAYYRIKGDRIEINDKCPDGYPLRPHVVWFGEEVPALNDAIPKISSANVLIVIGTSLNVYPAAGLIHYASEKCEKWIIDPKANELSIPNEFKIIQKGAVEGMKILSNYLKKKGDI